MNTAAELVTAAIRAAGGTECLTGTTYDPAEHARLKAEAYNRTEGSLPGRECRKCRNKGQIMVAHEDGSVAIRECECMSVRRSLRRLERSGLQELVQRCRFDSFQTPEPWQRSAKESARRYAAQPEGWFLAAGQPGSGKTHLCVAICRELMLRGMEVRYVLWRDAVTRLKATVNDAEAYQAIMEPLKRVPVLYLDDLYKTGRGQQPTVADVNVAFELLNARYLDQSKRTVISTERTIAELMDIDEAVGSRIMERCQGSAVQIVGTGKNWRVKRP